jgi:hypothetical protein
MIAMVSSFLERRKMSFVDILILALIWDLILGTAMLLYIAYSWHNLSPLIEKQGWTLDNCNPLNTPTQALLFYIPVMGIFWYMFAGSIISELATTKREEDTVVLVTILGITSTYFE